MSDIPSFPYDDLWQERKIRSVANLTRGDGHELLELAPQVPVPHARSRSTRSSRPSRRSRDLRAGRFEGTAVAVP